MGLVYIALGRRRERDTRHLRLGDKRNDGLMTRSWNVFLSGTP